MDDKRGFVMKKNFFFFFLLLVMSICLLGCSSEQEKFPDLEGGKVIKVYFVDESEMKLVTEKRQYSIFDDKQKVADDLIDVMLEEPERENHFVAIPSEVSINNVVARNNIINIDFAVGYENISREKDVICRAAIVKTLVQIDEIDYVEFSIGGKTMMDSDNTPIGSLTADSFVFDELPIKEKNEK